MWCLDNIQNCFLYYFNLMTNVVDEKPIKKSNKSKIIISQPKKNIEKDWDII